ncbi:MAG: DUF4349 domain-containing protein [Oscillospiraceae bacterium]|nr:DUF4349 domain-containing protein [Oscillospiraceae bacterium]
MKNRKLFALVLVLVLLLAGCAKSADGYAPMENIAVTQSPNSEGIYDSVSGETPEVSDRKLIRTVNLEAETEALDSLLNAVDAKVRELGGYIENRNVYTGSAYSSYQQTRRAELTVRIPAKQLDAFINHVSEAGNITSSSESAEDVTLSYVAVQSRMKALEMEEARLLELIEGAANLSELLELEKRLTEVRTELEQVTSQLRLYDNLVDYGTVKLSIREVQKLTPVEEPGFWERIGSGFVESLCNLWSFLKELVIFLVVSLPYLLPFAVAGLVVFLLIRRSVRKKRKKSKPPFETNPDN